MRDESRDWLIDPVLAIKINQTYREGMSGLEVYEATRGVWRLDRDRAAGARLVLAVVHGEVVEVFEPAGWFPAGSTHYATREFEEGDFDGRSEFAGRFAKEEVRRRYVGRNLPPTRSSSPILYFNC